jgi:prepilin-type N-terminal cleavage/methylation domain-containing protein
MCRSSKSPQHRPRRAGLTLVELLIATAILALMVAALGALTQAVKVSSEYTLGRTTATQHGRVALSRITAAVSTCYANESFPGAVVFAGVNGSYDYPDTLVVWRPASSTPANAGGLPLFSEIVVFCPNPNSPNELLEIKAPSDTRAVPALTNTASWNSELTNLKSGTASQKVLLTDLVRTAVPTGGSSPRAAIRFYVNLRPSASQWASFRAGTVAFNDVPWVQTVYGSQTGLRQTWVSSELQLMPSSTDSRAATVAIPFFGSVARYWNLKQ